MLINVRVIPRSRRNILEWEPGNSAVLKVHLTAPPVEGAANAALIALLAERLSMPKRAITIVRGTSSRQKVVDISGMNLEEITRRLKLQ